MDVCRIVGGQTCCKNMVKSLWNGLQRRKRTLLMLTLSLYAPE